MRLISDIVQDVKDEFGTSWNARYADDKPIVRFINKAISRLSGLLQAHQVPFFKKKAVFVLEGGRTVYPLPEDFGAAIGLYDPAGTALEHREREALVPGTVGQWAVEAEELLLSSVPPVTALVLYYWPLVPALAVSDPSPWGGRLDALIAQYAGILLKNVDEFNVQQDMQLHQEMERLLLSRFMAIDPVRRASVGWLGAR